MTEYTVKNNTETSFAGRNDGIFLTTTLWNQDGDIYVSINEKQTKLGVVYNQYCPVGYESGTTRTITGCTNTADSSVIYYWIEQGYTFDFNATTSDYYDLNNNTDKADRYYLSSTSPGPNDTLSVSDLNNLLNNDDLMQTIAAAYNGDSSAITDLTASKTDLGNFIAALNFFCGAKNHSGYGTSEQGGTWTSWSFINDDPINNLVYKALGFDSYKHITIDCKKPAYNDTEVYDADGRRFTDLGHSLLQENLDYGEVIRLDIDDAWGLADRDAERGHAIYIDGYKISGEEAQYHVNFGWGITSETTWYTDAQLAKYIPSAITIDLSPDINVVVSNDRSDYYGGSFERGMERVNNIRTSRVGDDAVSFAFDEDIKDSSILIDEVAQISSTAAVNFENINVNLYAETLDNIFLSMHSMNFELNDGSISIIGDLDSRNVIQHCGNDYGAELVLNDSFIYVGNYSSGIDSLVELLDTYTFSDLTEIDETIEGYAIYSVGDVDDVITLRGNSALLGNIGLISGNNTLSVESGSTFYGGFNGVNLTVNLTINSQVTDAMLVLTDNGNSFKSASRGTLNVTVEADKIAEGKDYILYSGAHAADYSINLTIDGVEADRIYDGLNKDNCLENLDGSDYTLKYEDNAIKLVYNEPLVISTDYEPANGSMVEGFTGGNVIVSAVFSVHAVAKYYRIGDSGEWLDYNSEVVQANGGVLVENNCNVWFRAVNEDGKECEKCAEISCIDKEPPPELVITSNKTDWTNLDVELTAGWGENVEPEDFDRIEYSLDNGSTWNVYSDRVVVEENNTVLFRAYDKRGNFSQTTKDVTNIDKTADSPIVILTPETETPDSVTVVLKCEDDIVLNQYYWVAGNDDTFTAADIKEWKTYSGALTFTENGILFLRSTDHLRNVSEITRHVIDNIDRTKPAKPEIFTDSDGRVTDKPVNVWADYGERKVVSIKYSTDNGNTWKVFDPGKPIELQENQKPEDISISLRAEDKAGNRSLAVNVTLDSKGMVAEMPEWQWTKSDAVNLQIRGEGDWENYTPGSKITFSKNGTVFFRAVDAAGNRSDTVEYRVNNIDTVADAVGKSKIFIDSKYTAANTQGKFQDGVLLEWGKTAFSSMEEARNKYDFSTQDVIIVANNLKSEDVDNLDGVKQLSAIQVTPSGSLTDHNYSYQSKGKAEKSFSLAGKDYSELELKWFKDVSLSSNSKVRSVEGGNAEHKSRQQYSKDGSSLTRHSSGAEAANGFFEASGEAAAGDVSGFLTVETANAKIGNLAGGKSSSVEDSKTVKKTNQEKHSISLKESVAAAGKALLKGNTILGEENQGNGNIENYKDVEVQSAIIYGLISNNKIDLQQSETLTRSSNKFNRNIAIKQNLSTDGTLQVDSSRITGGIQGYNEVILTSSQVGDVSRQSEDGGYGKEKKNWKISQDAKTGAITGKLTASMRSVNGGSISVSGNGATTDNISNFSKVTVVGGTVKDITNNTLLQSETSFLYNWASADVYGEQFDYEVNTVNCNNIVVLKVVEKHAANGQVLIQDDAVVGNVAGFAKVVVEGKGTLTSITAINDDIYGISGSLTLKMADNRKTKNGVSASGTYTNVVTLKPAASVKVTGYTVNGDIAGYKSVAITKATVGGNVDMGNAYTLKDVTSYKTSKGIVTKTFTTTQTFTNGGKISLKDTKVTGDVKDYATATLDNTQTPGNITNKTAVKIESKYSQTWDALELQRNPDTAMTLDEFMNLDPAFNAVLLSSFDKYAANGSVTLKNKSTAGNISGYKTVKLEGEALDGKTEPLKVGAITAVAHNDGKFYGSYQKKMTNKVSDSTGKSGTMTENITVASAGSVTVFGYKVNGNISGYKTVKLEDVNVAGDIVQGGNYTQKITTVYSIDSKTIDTVTTSKQTGTFKATDVIAQKADNTMGAVIGYNKVELKSSKVGDINQDRVTKETSRVIWDGDEKIFDQVISQTTKISGSVKLTDSVAGDISNYSSVTLDNSDAGALTNVNKVTVKGAYNSMDGFVGTDKNDTITIGKGAVLRVGGAMDFGNGKDKITIDGTLVLENIPPAAAGESVNIVAGLENVAGKGIIAADAELFKDVSVSLINSFGGTLMNLGNTSTGFRGTEFEKADDAKSGAVEWDGIAAYDGWLGTGDDIDCNDAVDFIRLVAEKDSKLSITMTDWVEGDTVSIADTEYVIPENGVITHNIKGGAAYIIEINRKAENSMSYTMSIA